MFNPHFESFQAKIIDKPFYAEGEFNYPSTAIISFFDKQGRFMFAHDYGHLTLNQIYERIDASGELILNHCYVHNFSATAYRRTRLKDKNEFVELKRISAKAALFSSEFNIDFSFLRIGDGDVDFSECCFANGDLLFNQTVCGQGKVDFSNTTIRCKKVDFANAQFGSGLKTFKNALFFEGSKDFQYADFGNGEVNFVNTDFGSGDISFINSNFNNGDVSFKVARFGDGKVDFHFCKFGEGDISFERTDFGNGLVDFKTVEFGSGKVNFNRAVFGSGEITFEGSAAEGRITFKKTEFSEGSISFELAEYENTELNIEKAIIGNCKLSFFDGSFYTLVLKGCHLNNYLDLRVRQCHEIDLSDTVVRDIIDLKPYQNEVKLSILNISGMRLLGTIYIDWKNNHVLNLIRNQHKTSLAEKAEQFRTLKESFNKSGQYSDEDYSYVWFKRYELLAEFSSDKHLSKVTRITRYPEYLFKKLVFDYAGLYATNPFRVMISMVTVYATFSLLYSFLLSLGLGGIVSGLTPEHNAIGIVGRSFFFSGVTFLTIGYGDFYPMGLIRGLSVLEGFTGVFLMSYFTVAFVRKILR
ncbi:MAG: hypothetical protein A2W95_00740 [Bacteroidetes bacterium GWA2_40_14]|jgi:hypothetical protein|nr:MAG: hypothetical protein A2W95_00740 [Bacteroidetes bacterium GWA2_40_14]HAZ01637.1 hypothetical protein [Marinilabiliales bacterium]